MSGQRIKGAIEALTFFLKSLPKDSYFQIISFGSRYTTMHKESIFSSTKNVENTISNLSTFGANMGGTEIYSPLSAELKRKPIPGYPKHIFLLTDGDVSNTSSVLRLINEERKYSTVHGIGIGDGCSR